jgi:hypothetical protein
MKMKITKTASGKRTLKISKTEWEAMGKQAGWLDKRAFWDEYYDGDDLQYISDRDAWEDAQADMESEQRENMIKEHVCPECREQTLDNNYSCKNRNCTDYIPDDDDLPVGM